MASPKIPVIHKRRIAAKSQQIYCRRHNRLYRSCPVENELHLCECLSQCETALKAFANGSLRRTG